jgi:hypothetical protein
VHKNDHKTACLHKNVSKSSNLSGWSTQDLQVDTDVASGRESVQERETDCHQVAIVGVRDPVDDLEISARVRPLLPCLREHNIKQPLQEKQPNQAVFFVCGEDIVDKPTSHADACLVPGPRRD